MPTFYDTHAHLDYPDFAGDLPQIIERARQAGVGTIISVATDLESSARAIKIAEQFPNVYAVVGWHPNDALKAPEDLRSGLRQLAGHPKVVGIGEIGLDYYRLPAEPSEEVAQIKRKQADIFVQQMEVAAEFGLNCVIHQRGRSLDDALALMAPFAAKVHSVFHCFSESPEGFGLRFGDGIAGQFYGHRDLQKRASRARLRGGGADGPLHVGNRFSLSRAGSLPWKAMRARLCQRNGPSRRGSPKMFPGRFSGSHQCDSATIFQTQILNRR